MKCFGYCGEGFLDHEKLWAEQAFPKIPITLADFKALSYLETLHIPEFTCITMGKKHKHNRERTRLSLGAFLQLESDLAKAVAPTFRPALPSSAEDSRPLIKALHGGYVASAADYAKDWPTPAEVRARHFKGLCLECQLIFATWGPPNNGFGIPYRESRNAHHSFNDLERCWCPLCKMLLREYRHYNEASMEVIQPRKHRGTRSHVRVYKHMRHVPCHYVELEFAAGRSTFMPSFRMFIAGESLPTSHSRRSNSWTP